jgi:hypothetical protein
MKPDPKKGRSTSGAEAIDAVAARKKWIGVADDR